MLSQSEVDVVEADKMIQGFVGLNDEYIEGIFVSEEMQSCGIGKLLLDYIKNKKVSLRLNDGFPFPTSRPTRQRLPCSASLPYAGHSPYS